MDRNITSDYGPIKIHRKVIRQVAETAALNVKGVKRVGWSCYGKIKGAFLKFFNLAGTRIVFVPDKTTKEIKETKIVIPLTVAWGENLVDVACQVQKSIIFHMLNDLGIETLTVTVKIKYIERG